MRDRLQLDALYFQCSANNNLLHRLSLKYRLKFSKGSTKLEELSKVLKGNSIDSKFNHIELAKIAEDIESESAAVPYILKENILALLVEGKKASYIAMINLSRSAVKLYADISNFTNLGIQDGVITEIFSDMNYLVSDGKIYVRRLPSMDCMVFAKYK